MARLICTAPRDFQVELLPASCRCAKRLAEVDVIGLLAVKR